MIAFAHMGTRRIIALLESVGISTKAASCVIDWERSDAEFTFILSKHRRLSSRS